MKSHKLILSMLIGAPLAVSAAPVADENFNDVTGLGSAASTRTVADILSSSPAQLPTGSLWTSLAVPPSAADVNVRRADNTINTTAGASGFDSLFAPANAGNNFLVLGDQTGTIGNNPSTGVFAFVVPFHVAPSQTQVTIDFDWAFDGTDTSTALTNKDTFIAGVAGDGFSMSNPTAIFTTLIDRSSPAGFSSGHFSQTFATSSLPVPVPVTGLRYLVFALTEGTALTAPNGTNSAVGIDNILVAAVPEPETYVFMLAGLGLVAFAAKRRLRV
jgi:hypothetical protein